MIQNSTKVTQDLRFYVHSSMLAAVILVASPKIFAAACCGGGFAAPSIIAGDDKAQLTTSVTSTEVVVDNVDAEGVWRKSTDHQRVQTLKIEAAHVFQDRWQAGLSIPVIQRTQQDQSYSGLGDVATTLGYEYLPDWDYNPLRPKGIGFLQLTLPTGKSKYESDVGALDSRGNGFLAFGIGTLLTKNIGIWDLFISLEGHQSSERSVKSKSFSGTVKPGFGSNAGFGLGFNLKDFRIGSSITWTREDSVELRSDFGEVSKTGDEKYATAVASLSYLRDDDWSGTVSYSDQTLFGETTNTSLSRGLVLQIQRRWGR